MVFPKGAVLQMSTAGIWPDAVTWATPKDCRCQHPGLSHVYPTPQGCLVYAPVRRSTSVTTLLSGIAVLIS
jgi:hypothetical protein